MSDEVSIKETSELLDGLGEIAITAKKIAKDGKVNAADIQHLIELSAKLDIVVDGVKGADQIPAELKDLDQNEVLDIIGQVYKISDKINKA